MPHKAKSAKSQSTVVDQEASLQAMLDAAPAPPSSGRDDVGRFARGNSCS
jgi:hypothetical protein